MEDIEKKLKKETEDELYSKEDFESYKANLQNEFLEKEEAMKKELENEAKKANMTELELAQTELAEIKQKYEEKEKECLISNQKEDTKLLLAEAGLEDASVELVYVPLDMEATKAKIAILKAYIEEIKKNVLQNCMDTPLPPAPNQATYDAFVEGFDTNKL